MGKKIKQAEMASSTKFINSFFAGIGGFDLAFEREGFKAQFYCEVNEFCRSVLKRHWPDVANASDIVQLNSKSIPKADVWTAGFPCQDLSLARTPHGKRNGLKGKQSGLFYTFLDLLAQQKPKVVLLENVAGLLNSHKGADFHALLMSLTKLGYAVSWRVLNARYFGAPQSRPRIFICAWNSGPGNAIRALYEDEIAAKPKNERQGFIVESYCSNSGASVPQVSFCISATSGRHTGLDWARSYVTYANKVRRLTPLECERLQGLPENWTLPDKSYVVPIRGIETNRYHAIGNAVCVPVVQWVARRISGLLSSVVGDSIKTAGETGAQEEIVDLAAAFLSPRSELQKLSDDPASFKWSTGGIAYGDWFVTTNVSSSILKPVSSRFIDVIETANVHERYFLSVNAMQGILRRVDKLGRNLFPPLDKTLRAVVTSSLVNESRVPEEEMNSDAQSKEVLAL